VTVGGSNTQLNDTAGLALDAADDLYVANENTPSIAVYASGSTGNVTPLRTIAGTNTRLVDPTGIALDPSGCLSVANGDRQLSHSVCSRRKRKCVAGTADR
jgi:hypothetical protein